MRKHKILFAAAGILLAVMLVLSACTGKGPEPDTDTGGNESHLYTEPTHEWLRFSIDDCEMLYPWFILQSEATVLLYEKELSDTGFDEFSGQIRDGERDIPFPYRNGEPITVQTPCNVYSWLNDDTFCRPCIWYNWRPPASERSVEFEVSFLTEEEAQMAREMSCPDFVRIMSPSSVNTHNYRGYNCKKAWEETVQMDERTVSVLIRQWENDAIRVSFAYDDFYVTMSVAVADWYSGYFADFSVRTLPRPEISAVTPLPDTTKSVESNEYLKVGDDASRFYVSSLKFLTLYPIGHWLMFQKPDGTIVNTWAEAVGADLIIQKIYEIPAPKGAATPEMLESISPGTPINEVIRIGGIPSGGSFMKSWVWDQYTDYLDFTCSDGSVYRFYVSETTAEEDGKTVLTGDWYVTWVRKVS